MKRVLFVLLYCILCQLLPAQGDFTSAYQQYRPYHYQTPQAWNRIRREVSTNGREKWPFIDTEKRDFYLAGTFPRLIPSPLPTNTYFFRRMEDIGRIYELLMKPEGYGYIVYPFWMEEQFKLSEIETIKQKIVTKGFMNTLISSVSSAVEEKLDEIVYISDSVGTSASTEPVIYDDGGSLSWLKEAEQNNLYNIKNYYCYFDSRPDTLRQKIRYTTQVTKNFESEVARLDSCVGHNAPFYSIIPYWMTDVFMALPAQTSSCRIRRFGYPGYVINPVSGMPELNNNWGVYNLMDASPYSEKGFDLLAYCGDAASTNRFLTNPEACRRFIYTVFSYPSGMINRPSADSTTALRKPLGLNLYLPEFDFSEKRALTQLVKSLSLVIDSFNVTGKGHVYGKMDLLLTFSKKAASDYAGFISGLQCFVDTVYFADFDAYGMAKEILTVDRPVDSISMAARISNPFYLFRIPYKSIKPGVNDGDLWQLSECDYASGQWGLYFCIDLGLIILLFVLTAMRYTSATFNRYAEQYRTFVALFFITLVMECAVFFFFMIEALSPQVIFFDLSGGSMTYLALIGLPILPIVAYIIALNVNRRRERLP